MCNRHRTTPVGQLLNRVINFLFLYIIRCRVTNNSATKSGENSKFVQNERDEEKLTEDKMQIIEEKL
ncbi:unnamed protein product [Camellia sinensis]